MIIQYSDDYWKGCETREQLAWGGLAGSVW